MCILPTFICTFCALLSDMFPDLTIFPVELSISTTEPTLLSVMLIEYNVSGFSSRSTATTSPILNPFGAC